MNTFLGPTKAKQLKHFEELLEVQRLLRADDVEHTVKGICVMTVDCRRQIPGDIKGCTIFLLQQTGREAMLLQVGHKGTLALLCQAAGAGQFDSPGQTIIIIAFPHVGIKTDS